MFYPIEDQTELVRIRSFMSPFMINIQKCFSPKELYGHQKEQICDDVLNSINSAVNPALMTGLNGIIEKPENRTLGLEQGALRQISLRYFWLQEKFKRTFLSSFQHHDLFKITSHLTQSYRRENSMISDRMRSQGKYSSRLSKNLNDC